MFGLDNGIFLEGRRLVGPVGIICSRADHMSNITRQPQRGCLVIFDIIYETGASASKCNSGSAARFERRY